jgi:hypothetical protein
VLLYNNPSVACAIERDAAFDLAPAVVVTRTDGTERVFDLRAMAAATPGRVDLEVFRALGAPSDVEFAADVAYGDGSTSVKVRRDRRAARAGDAAATAVAADAGAAAGAGAAEKAAPAAAAAPAPPKPAAVGAAATAAATAPAGGAADGGKKRVAKLR